MIPEVRELPQRNTSKEYSYVESKIFLAFRFELLCQFAARSW